MYIAIYYPAIVDAFGLPININVLIGEDKYREFKKQIFSTNYRNLEKDLLLKENLRQSLRFLLVGSFDDKLTTTLIKDLYTQCLALFSTLLLRLEAISLTEAEEAVNDNNKLEGLEADASYISPSTTRYI